MILSFISENQKKLNQYQELQRQLAPDLFEFAKKTVLIDEIQSVDGEEVIREKIAQIRKTTSLPFVVDDVSLIVGTNAYPGALIKHLLKNNDIKTLPLFLPNHAPVIVCCLIGFFDGFESFVFKGEVQGTTCFEACAEGESLGLDTLIQVDGGSLGALDQTENHRGRAFQELVKHFCAAKVGREQHNKQVTERWSARAESWQSVREDATSYVNHENGYARFDAEVKRILPLVSGSALDVGCGDGEVTRLIASNSAITDVLGMDISPEMVRVSSEKNTDERIRFEVGTFSKVDLSYHLITSRGVVLSHMHRSDILPTLTAMAQSLLPNGYLVFDYISNLENNDDVGRMSKNQLRREWIVAVLSELGLVNVSYSGSEEHRVSVLVFHKPTAQSIYFATSNSTKVIELQSKCKNHLLHLVNIDTPEIKNDDIIEIAKDKAKKSYELLKYPVIVTDGGIFINALKGFPGPNSKQAATLLGPKKLLSMLTDETDRTAIRRNCMVFYDGHDYKVCIAEVPLVISASVTDSEYKAYPLDTILVPLHEKNPLGLTYKQMPVEERVLFTELPFFEQFIATL